MPPQSRPPSQANVPETRDKSIDWLLNYPRFVDLPKIKIRSRLEILLLCAGVAAGVFLIALGLQWVVYDRILHEDGIRIVGSTIAAGLAALLTERLESASRSRSLQELRRLEMLAVINHHIRNALQTIIYAGVNASEAGAIQAAVDRIEWTLREVLPHVQDLDKPDPPRRHVRSA